MKWPRMALRPFAERNFARHRRPMQIKPGKNGFRLRPLRHMVAGEIGEALVIPQHHAAMALAIPQAGLGLDSDVMRALLGYHVLHMVNQRLPARAPVGARGFASAE